MTPRSRAVPQPRSAEPPARQLAAFIARFDAPIARQIRACRRALQRLLPTAHELVYDNYNFFVIGYSTTERPSDCIVSLVASAKGVGLSFYYGSTLPDPSGILQGSGNQNRFVRLAGPQTLREPAIAAVIRAAVRQADPPPATTGRGTLVIRAVAARRRSRS